MTGSNSFWFAKTGASFYNDVISRSLKIDDNTDARLSRTLGTATDRAKYTLSWWMKVGNTPIATDTATIFDSGLNGSNYSFIYLNNGRTLACNGVSGGSNSYALTTNDMLRDPTAWYHCMFVYNSSASTTTDRIYFIVNGTRLTSTTGSPTYPSSGVNDPYWNNSNAHYIGYGGGAANVTDFDGYLADIYHIDGQALDADDFTELKNGVRIPKEYTGSYGDNGFHLAFASGTGTGTASSSTIGADTSGNDLHFTTTNIDSNDVMLDSPEVNFATINFLGQSLKSTVTASEGNLFFDGSTLSPSNYDAGVVCNFGMKGGKWYWETRLHGGGTPPADGSRDWAVGFAPYSTVSKSVDDGTYGSVLGNGSSATLSGYGYYNNSGTIGIRHNNSISAFGSAHASDDILGHALDLENGTWVIYKNGSSLGTAATGIDTSLTYFAAGGAIGGTISSFDVTFNFGQDSTFNGAVSAGGNADGGGVGDFKYAVPSGYLACCTRNLDDSTLGPNSDELPNQHYQNYLFTGDSNSTRTISGLNFQPDLLWSKTRDTVGFTHRIYDSTRGADKGFKIGDGANLYAIESTNDLFDGFTSDGYKTTTDGSAGDLLNYDTANYINWLWRANAGTTTTNDASATSVGNIDSVYQANTTAGFSIVQYTGTGSAGGIAHGLGAVPHFILIKNRTHNSGNGSGTNWVVYHRDMDPTEPQDYSLYISTAGRGDYVGMFNDTAPTSTTFTVGTHMTVNSGDPNYYMAYVWTEIANFSRFGLYNGNGNTNGPYVHLGFRPALLVVKNRDTTGSWAVSDSARSPFNEVANTLLWDDDATESGVSNDLNVDFTANGFKIRDSNSHYNSDGAEYIYAAWAEMPTKYANAY